MTMESLGGALVVLAAVLLGAALPALVQLRATLKALESTGARADAVLAATGALAVRLDALVTRVDRGGRIERLLDGVAEASATAAQLGDTVRWASAFGAAVAPAVAAAVQAFHGGEGEGPPAAEPDHDSSPPAGGANA